MELVWFLSPFLCMRTEKGSNLPKFTLLGSGRTGIGKGSSCVEHEFIWSLYPFVKEVKIESVWKSSEMRICFFI